MPKGVYQHKPMPNRITKDEVTEFVKFCFRPDIAHQLQLANRPHQVAVKLYEIETGKVISTQTAYKQRDKWECLYLPDGTIEVFRKGKVEPPKINYDEY